MRVVKVLIALIVAMVIVVPVGIVALLAVVASIGQSAGSRFDELADVQTVSHASPESNAARTTYVPNRELTIDF